MALGLTAALRPTIRGRERRGGEGVNNILAIGGNKVIDLANIFSTCTCIIH